MVGKCKGEAPGYVLDGEITFTDPGNGRTELGRTIELGELQNESTKTKTQMMENKSAVSGYRIKLKI